MFFALPWMLLGLLGLPALAAIYWLRSRAKPRTVSSLFLWADQRRPRQGGRIFQRLQTPLTFLLELLAIAAIAVAAAAPAVTRSRYARPLVLVLDDSYSMLAGGDASTRDRASQKLAEEFRRTDYVARVILAGAQPRLLGATVRSADQLPGILVQWTCTAPTAGLEPAIALASEVGGASSRILVVTDHAPSGELPAGKIEWWGCGQTLGNIAITAASRDASAGGADEDRVLLEVTNFGIAPAQTELVLSGANLGAPSHKSLELDAGAATRIILNLTVGSAELHATLGKDDLAIDNEVVLVSPRRRPLRVQFSMADADKSTTDLRALLVRAVESCGQAVLVETRPDLVITDHEQPKPANAWQFEALRGPDPLSYEGPFVLDRSHPLTEGLSLDAVIWSAAPAVIPGGTPVVTAGNRVLMADSEDASGRHKIQMVLDPDLSNLTATPDWPILVANLVRWCLAATPGPAASNIRLGQTLRITLADDATATGNAVITPPGTAAQSLPIHGKQLEVHPDRIGLYHVRAGSLQFPFACNALNADESNLATCASGKWGSWNESDVYQDQRVSLDWAFILLALGCLTVQMVIVSRAGVAGS